MKKRISKQLLLEKVYLSSLQMYNIMNEIASMISKENLNKCYQLNKRLKKLTNFINKNIYLIKDPVIRMRFVDLKEIAQDYYTNVQNYDPSSEEDMENRIYLVLTSQTYGKEIIDMYQYDQFPNIIYENFNFRQDGRIIIDKTSNHYESK